MIEPITIRGNIRMTNYGQLIYNKNQEHFYTWHEELDYIIKEYPITNPIYEYSHTICVLMYQPKQILVR